MRHRAPWSCWQCGAEGFRNVGTKGYCATHLADLYRRFSAESWGGLGIGLPVGERRDDELHDLVCVVCAAGWVGPPFDECPWCARAIARQVEDQRRMLLDPPWLASDAGDPRYDELSEVDKAVWDRTRGQRRDADSIKAWVERLARAVIAGVITEDEARRACDRYDRRDRRHAG